MNAADILKYGHRTVLRAVDGLSGDDWTSPGACGRWSIQDLVAHLASYERATEDVVLELLGVGPTPTLDRLRDPESSFNDREVEARRGRDVGEVLSEYNEAVARVAALVAQVPEDRRREPGLLPWYGEEYALDDLLVYMVYGHKREHAAQIAAFRDELGR